VRDITVDGQDANVGFVFGNRGGATRFERVHLQQLRCGLSWWDYTDGNSFQSVSLVNVGGTAIVDGYICYQITNGDGVVFDNCKTSAVFGLVRSKLNAGMTIRSSVGCQSQFDQVWNVVVSGVHHEMNSAGISTKRAYQLRDTKITLTGIDAQPADGASSSDGTIYIDDSNNTGFSSQIDLIAYRARRRLVATDQAQSADIFLNQLAQESIVRVRSADADFSISGSSVANRWPRGYVIDGNAGNLPTLAAAIVAGRDFIGSGDFSIRWRGGKIMVGMPGGQAGLKITRLLSQPSFGAFSTTGLGALGSLTNGTLYEYALALAFTMPDGTIVYGQVSLAGSATPATNGSLKFNILTPSGTGGCTLVVWRKTTAGVLTAPDRWLALPWGHEQSALVDTGANLNSVPWITSGTIPVSSTVAGINHTGAGVYLDGVLQ
jgi:hypothetical protein